MTPKDIGKKMKAACILAGESIRELTVALMKLPTHRENQRSKYHS